MSAHKIFVDADLIISAFDEGAKGRSKEQIEHAKMWFKTCLQSEEYTLFTNPLVKYEVLRAVPRDSHRYRKLLQAFDLIVMIDVCEKDADLSTHIWQQAHLRQTFKPDTRSFDILHFSCAMNNKLSIESQNRRDFPAIAQLHESIQQSN